MTNLGCTSPWYESCLCRDDLSPTASSFLTKCVNRDCSTAAYDLGQAVSVYNGYCGRQQQQQVVTTAVDSASPTVHVITTVTSTSGSVVIISKFHLKPVAGIAIVSDIWLCQKTD
jgi:hypothetical protein